MERESRTASLEQIFPCRDDMAERLSIHLSAEEISKYIKSSGIDLSDVLTWPKAGSGELTDKGILRHLIAGNIIIYPFHANQLGPNSYDVTLGRFCMRWEERRRPVYNPLDPQNVSDVWKKDVAKTRHEVEREMSIKFTNVDHDDEIIVLYPREMLLAHTEEIIGGVNIIIPKISGKSTSGRNMIEMCSDANMGNIGFVNRYTLEVVNKSGYTIPLIVGEAYASFSFVEAQEIPGRSYAGRYQGSLDVVELTRAWVPEMMLPRMKRLVR